MTLSEGDFQRQVTDLAEVLGWRWVHFRAARTSHGWRVPVSGPLGAGWPDLVLVRGPRMIFVELKADRGKVTPEQDLVLTLLCIAGAQAATWRPKDMGEPIEESLVYQQLR